MFKGKVTDQGEPTDCQGGINGFSPEVRAALEFESLGDGRTIGRDKVEALVDSHRQIIDLESQAGRKSATDVVHESLGKSGIAFEFTRNSLRSDENTTRAIAKEDPLIISLTRSSWISKEDRGVGESNPDHPGVGCSGDLFEEEDGFNPLTKDGELNRIGRNTRCARCPGLNPEVRSTLDVNGSSGGSNLDHPVHGRIGGVDLEEDIVIGGKLNVLAETGRESQSHLQVGRNALRVHDDHAIGNSRGDESLVAIAKLKDGVGDRDDDLTRGRTLEGEVAGQTLSKNIEEDPHPGHGQTGGHSDGRSAWDSIVIEVIADGHAWGIRSSARGGQGVEPDTEEATHAHSRNRDGDLNGDQPHDSTVWTADNFKRAWSIDRTFRADEFLTICAQRNEDILKHDAGGGNVGVGPCSAHHVVIA